MNVLLAATSVSGQPAADVAARSATFWSGAATPVGVSDGGGDLVDVAAELLGGQIQLLDGALRIVTVGTRWIADLEETWEAATTADLFRQARASATRLVVNMPCAVVPDLGEAVMAELGCASVAELNDYLAGLDIVVTAPAGQPLLGVNGLPRLLARRGELSDEEAQGLEIDLGARLPGPQRSMLMGKPDAKADYAGVGGGLGLVLVACGARFMTTGAWVAGHAWTDTDLLVYVTGDVGLDMPASLVHLAQRAQAASVPAIIVYRDGALLRHELATFGLSGAYSYGGGADLDHLMERVARTWLGPLLHG